MFLLSKIQTVAKLPGLDFCLGILAENWFFAQMFVDKALDFSKDSSRQGDAMNKERVLMTSSWTLAQKSFELFQENFQQLIFLLVIPDLVLQVGSIVFLHNMTVGGLLMFVGCVWLIITIPALQYFEIMVSRGKTLTVMEAYRQGLRFFWRVLGFAVAFSVVFLIGLALLIVPGLIVLRRYLLGSYYIVDQDVSMMEAARRSAAQTKPVSGYVWGSLGVVLLLAVLTGIVGVVIDKLTPFASGLLGVVATTIIGSTYLFILPLRYVEIVKRTRRRKASGAIEA